MHRVGARRKRRAAATSVRRVAGLLPVNHVGGDGQDRLRRYRVAVRRQRLDFLHKALNQIAGDTVHAIVVVAVLRIVAFDDEIDRQTGVVAHRFYRGVFDGRQGIRRHRQPGNAAGHGAVDVPVVQRHQRGFVAVFIMHIVNEIQRADVLHRQPVHEVIEARHYGVVIQYLIQQRLGFRTDLDLQLLIHPAVDCVQQRFRKVGACAEELHLLADHHRADAAGNGVVVAVEVGAHQIVVLVLQRGGDDRHLRGVFLERDRQLFGPEDRQVWLRRRPHGVQGMQVAEAVFSHQRAPVQPHAANHFRGPDRIAGEERVELRRAQEAHHADLHDEVVDQLLGLHLIQPSCLHVAFNVDIEERGRAPQRHRPAVLGFHCGKVGKVDPLHRFLRIHRRT